MPANCAEISKVTSSGGNWILQDLGPPEEKTFDLKYSSCIRLWNTTIKNWFHRHLENFISFPLIYRFAGIRRVLTELEADHWKHRSNYAVTLSESDPTLESPPLQSVSCWETLYRPCCLIRDRNLLLNVVMKTNARSQSETRPLRPSSLNSNSSIPAVQSDDRLKLEKLVR